MPGNDPAHIGPLDEARERKGAGKLALRGLLAAGLGGALWAWPANALLFRMLLVIAAAALIYISTLSLMVAGLCVRNILGRWLGWHHRPHAVRLLGLGILMVIAGCGTALFVIAGHLWG